jgi:hypothetical protein
MSDSTRVPVPSVHRPGSLPLLGSSRSSYFLFGWRGHGGNLISALRLAHFRSIHSMGSPGCLPHLLAGARRWRKRICPLRKWQMANTMVSLVGTLEVVWHIVGWGLAVALGTLWAWELVASRQRAKAMRNVQDWPLSSHTSNLSRPDTSSLAPEPAAKTNSDILSSIARPAVHRQTF